MVEINSSFCYPLYKFLVSNYRGIDSHGLFPVTSWIISFLLKLLFLFLTTTSVPLWHMTMKLVKECSHGVSSVSLFPSGRSPLCCCCGTASAQDKASLQVTVHFSPTLDHLPAVNWTLWISEDISFASVVCPCCICHCLSGLGELDCDRSN